MRIKASKFMEFRISVLISMTAAGTFSLFNSIITASASAAEPESVITSKIPYDVTNDPQKIRELVSEYKIPEAHRLFDLMSWQAFIALNWPTKERGKPGPDMSDNDSWRAWNYWRSASSIFLANGIAPEPWTGQLHHSPTLQSIPNQVSRRYNPNEALEAFTGPLVDQNGNWVHFDIRVDKEEFDYIVDNKLYSLNGQVEFSNREKNNAVDFPLNHGLEKYGAIEIKLAWKEMGPNDDTNRFYITTIDIPSAETVSQTKPVKVGLVGMHIAMRTESSPEWIWSTFEQIDNVRSNRKPDGTMSHPNFFNAGFKTTAVNILPAKNAYLNPDTGQLTPADPLTANNWIESLTTAPVQVARIVVPTQTNLNPWDKILGQVTAGVNAEVQKALAAQNSVFQYYELIDTQWPVHPNFPAFAGGQGSAPESVRFKTPGDMVPVFLINAVMETYFQTGPQAAGGMEQDDRIPDNTIIDSTRIFGTESCVGCHYSSGIATGFKKNADGTIAMNKVTKKPIPIFGENNHSGKTGGANFSWMLQLEPDAENGAPASLPYDAGLPTAASGGN
jgi:hypothetical protein